MYADRGDPDALGRTVKGAYERIEPPDSWESLRNRIKRTIETHGSSLHLTRKVTAWRRIAVGLAACFLVSAGLATYAFWFSGQVGEDQFGEMAVSGEGLFTQKQLEQLHTTFSNVAQLFGQYAPWVMVSSTRDAEIGVRGRPALLPETAKVVVVRLAVESKAQPSGRSYFDIVMFDGQRAQFQVPLAGAPAVDVSLKPQVDENGQIVVQVAASVGGVSEARSIGSLAEDAYTALVGLRANGDWVSVQGIARFSSNI